MMMAFAAVVVVVHAGQTMRNIGAERCVPVQPATNHRARDRERLH